MENASRISEVQSVEGTLCRNEQINQNREQNQKDHHRNGHGNQELVHGQSEYIEGDVLAEDRVHLVEIHTVEILQDHIPVI